MYCCALDWTKQNQQSAKLSQALAKSLGLLSDKGLPKYQDKQVATWTKRLELVKKKVKS
jgi:hypothetical protein